MEGDKCSLSLQLSCPKTFLIALSFSGFLFYFGNTASLYTVHTGLRLPSAEVIAMYHQAYLQCLTKIKDGSKMAQQIKALVA